MPKIADHGSAVHIAAQKALDAGVIKPGQFKDMTDGTVSYADLAFAQHALKQAEANPSKRELASNLVKAVDAQIKEQGVVRSAMEGGNGPIPMLYRAIDSAIQRWSQ